MTSASPIAASDTVMQIVNRVKISPVAVALKCENATRLMLTAFTQLDAEQVPIVYASACDTNNPILNGGRARSSIPVKTHSANPRGRAKLCPELATKLSSASSSNAARTGQHLLPSTASDRSCGSVIAAAVLSVLTCGEQTAAARPR